MLKIGITGGIGSGKSTVCKIFKCLGIPVFDADKEAKLIYVENEDLKQIIINEFGGEIYPNGMFDKNKLASIVFNSEERIKKLNSIVHPLVYQRFENWYHQQDSPYIIKEAALLIEAGSYKDLDHVILVSAPLDIRIKRTMHRDHATKDEVLNRINKQMNEEEKRTFCDLEIVNDEKHLLIPQVKQIHEQFKLG